MPDQVYVTDKRLDPDKMIFEGVITDGEKDPRYTVSECAKFFFGRSPHWIRWLEQEFKLVLDGAPDCAHHDEEIVVVPPKRGKPKKPKTKVVKHSWLVDGVCPRCGGREVGARKTESGMRNYTLGDVEEMAHALAQNTAISGTQLSNALIALQTEGKIWGKI